jgi:hypothetical protein
MVMANGVDVRTIGCKHTVFSGEYCSLADVLEAVAAWLNDHGELNVLDMTVTLGDYLRVTVYYR